MESRRTRKKRKNGSKVTEFLSEIYMLKRIKRSGWSVIDAPQDSVAEHITITAQISYVLAKMEGLNAERCAVMALFHDNDETRLGDLHKIATLYLDKDLVSMDVLKEQVESLPYDIKSSILELMAEEKKKETPESIIIQDADRLEAAIQAKILIEKGYERAKDWWRRVKKHLRTKSAQIILAEIGDLDDFVNYWWNSKRRRIIGKE